MIVPLYTVPDGEWTEKLPVTEEYPRHWVTIVDLEITLSNGYTIKTPKGTIWDGASIPKWAWWIFKPIDEAAIADYLHDCLWIQKREQLEYFSYNIYLTRLFADNERNAWRNKLAPRKIIKNTITNFVIRKIGGFYYSKQLFIPT